MLLRGCIKKLEELWELIAKIIAAAMNEDDSDSGEEDSDSSDSDEIDPRKLKTWTYALNLILRQENHWF